MILLANSRPRPISGRLDKMGCVGGDVIRSRRRPKRIRQRYQHSCYEGQSSEPKAVNLGRWSRSRSLIRL